MLDGLQRLILGALYAAAAALTFSALGGNELIDPTEPIPATVSFESPRIQALAGPALESVTYPWREQLPGWRIEFVSGASNIAGYTWSREERIEVFVRPGATSADLARILAHELGHAVDVSKNDGDERREWLAARNAEEAPWWPGNGLADFATGAGDFAESFAVWQVGAVDYRGELAPAPTEADLELLERLSFD